MATEYEPPTWGVDGANAFGIFVEVIKSGVVLERVALPVTPGRSCAVAGRLPPPTCDLELAHASASRVHAALQFDAQGALFLVDLGSTHGSFVNKRRAPPREFVRLHIGDVLAFGESSRLYAVCGPEELLPAEYDSLNLRALRDKSAKRQEKKATQRLEYQQRDDGASWGFREDAVEEKEEGEDDDDDDNGDSKEALPEYLRNLKSEDAPYTSSVKQSDLSDKDQKLFAQLQARIRKMENLKLEKARIEAKQHQLTGLSEGQEATLTRNEQRIQALHKEIEDIEDRIHAKNAQRAKTKSSSAAAAAGRKTSESAYGYESDEDDFYDRTASNQRKHDARKQQTTALAAATTTSSGGVLTAESIEKTIATLERELREVERQQDDAMRAQKTEAEEEADSLDSFMASTAKELHATHVAAIDYRRQEVEAELRHQRQLLAIATPALARVAAQAAPTPTQRPTATTLDATSAPTVSTNSEPQEADELTKSGEERAPVVKRPAAAQELVADEAPESAEHRETVVAATDTERTPNTSQAKKRRVVGPALGAPRASATAAGRSSSAARTGAADAAVRGESSELQGGERVWVPPADQTGDGRTKLNDKFGY